VRRTYIHTSLRKYIHTYIHEYIHNTCILLYIFNEMEYCRTVGIEVGYELDGPDSIPGRTKKCFSSP
jgi:hypothetical protein